MDIPLVIGNFTWSNNRDPLIDQELIVFLSLQIGKRSFLICLKKRVPRLCSDHFSILFDCGKVQGGKKIL